MNDDDVALRRTVTLGVALGYGTAGWLTLVDRGLAVRLDDVGGVLLSIFVVGTLAFPAVLVGVQVLGRLLPRAALSPQTALAAVGGAVVVGTVHLAHASVMGPAPASLPAGGAAADAGLQVLVALPAALVLAVLGARAGLSTRPPRVAVRSGDAAPARAERHTPVGWARIAASVASGGLALAVAATAAPVTAAPLVPATAPAGAGTGVCVNAARTITYEVEAMSLDLPVNGWGDHIPDGMIYALRNDDAIVSAADIQAEPGRATPLVLRAAVGDCIEVTLTNSIEGTRVGMHVDGIAKEVTGERASDGANIGLNDDSTVATGATRTYTWYAARTGQFVINDYGSGTNHGAGIATQDTTSHGLYGALVVVPAGYTWHDPVTQDNLLSDDGRGLGAPVFADVHGPGPGDDYRDLALVFFDENEDVLDKNDQKPVFPQTGLEDSSFGFNYRSEPLRNRFQAVLDHRAGKVVTPPNGTVVLPQDHFCDGWTTDQSEEDNLARLAKDRGTSSCQGEEAHLQSWVFGDPGKMTRAVDEVDVLEVSAGGGTFTMTLPWTRPCPGRSPTTASPWTAWAQPSPDRDGGRRRHGRQPGADRGAQRRADPPLRGRRR